MNMRRHTRSDNPVRAILAGLVAMLFLALPTTARAYQDTLPDTKEMGLPADFPRVEQIIDQAVKNIGVRYNLNEAQLAKTNDIMHRDVRRFLSEHHDQVWPVIRELITTQLNGNIPEKAKAMRIGRAARPLAKLAYDAIVRGNEEWAEILTEEQRAMHRFDMNEIRKGFEEIDTNLRSWELGAPSDKPIFPAARAYPNEPPKPPKPAPGIPKRDERPTNTNAMVVPFDVGLFEARVNQFIEEYGLDEAQVVKARSLQRDFEVRGQQHLDANKEALAEATAAKEKAKRDKDREADAKAEAKLKELRQPLIDLLAQMDARLMTLLTQQQIKQHAAKQAAPRTAEDREGAAPSTPKKATPDKKN